MCTPFDEFTNSTARHFKCRKGERLNYKTNLVRQIQDNHNEQTATNQETSKNNKAEATFYEQLQFNLNAKDNMQRSQDFKAVKEVWAQ